MAINTPTRHPVPFGDSKFHVVAMFNGVENTKREHQHWAAVATLNREIKAGADQDTSEIHVWDADTGMYVLDVEGMQQYRERYLKEGTTPTRVDTSAADRCTELSITSKRLASEARKKNVNGDMLNAFAQQAFAAFKALGVDDSVIFAAFSAAYPDTMTSEG